MDSRIRYINIRDNTFRIEHCIETLELDPCLSVVLLLCSFSYLYYLLYHLDPDPKMLDDEDNFLEERLIAAGHDLNVLEIDKDFLCPIGYRVMVDPVLIQYSDNLSSYSTVSFEREVMEEFDRCPLARRSIASLVSNKELKQKIELWVCDQEGKTASKAPLSYLFKDKPKREKKPNQSIFPCNIL